ncbi:hypothetical protein Natpe_3200 [Natrinema pellirubrum DSM 15624]|uniref:Uncharacterized protein n=2 Tax=Natrinema pellirubrum (strain DSM 15624 / CIP 106293 / JCM 10476 / NCIMB 786 / 157) TaxID=797303 RepID=L0JN81_NATP1|nr:hypothetical protein [Natrinema pellirubrum]AGB32990.1 hypothetical protein Natpe_3200 [Natrinema pellirubrum DSM 15624]
MDLTAGSPARSRAVTAMIVSYFAVLAYATATNDPRAVTLTELGFGVIAIAVGTMLYGQRSTTGLRSVLTVGAGSLVAGGVLNFGAVLTRSSAVETLSSLLVFLGVGCYVYAVWRS